MNGLPKRKFNLPNIFGKISPATAPIDSIDNSAIEQCTTGVENLISSLSESTQAMSLPFKTPISKNISIPRQPFGSDETRFSIPKFSLGSNSSVSPSSCDVLTPHEISLKKIMDLKKLHIAADAQENVAPMSTANENNGRFHVDLTKALATEPNDRVNDAVIPMETIDYKFIDCEMPAAKLKRAMANMPRITHECEIDIANILSERLTNRTKQTTAFGKILCSRFRCTKRPQIKHGFHPKHKIAPFPFDVLHKFAQKKSNV